MRARAVQFASPSIASRWARLVALLSIVSWACGAPPSGQESSDAGRSDARLSSARAKVPNLLLMVADDVGTDRVAVYGEHPSPGRTPNIDRLAARGLLFRRAWSNPLCSPTRATLLTGRYGFRTGIGNLVAAEAPEDAFQGLPLTETTLPEVLAPEYRSVALGKWHLATDRDGPDHPRRSGFHAHAGSMRNLYGPDDEDAGVDADPPASSGERAVSTDGRAEVEDLTYSRWVKAVDGELRPCRVYATTDTVDDAVSAARSLPEPWFLYVAFNASHRPLHAPPPDLHHFELAGSPVDRPVRHVKAMTEALDTEIGRLLEAIDLDDTTVVFVGDNGTLGEAAGIEDRRGKGSLWEGGIRVPLIVAGYGVDAAGAECAALVNTTDLFATFVELGGKEIPGNTDGISLLPYFTDPGHESLRRFAYAEKFAPNGFGPYFFHAQTVRDGRYKLIRRFSKTPVAPRLFDLTNDPMEQDDLMQRPLSGEARAAYERLEGWLDGLTEGGR